MRFVNNLHYMFFFSLLMHIVILGPVAITVKNGRNIFTPSSYEVRIITPAVKKRVKIVPKKSAVKKRSVRPSPPKETQRKPARTVSKSDIRMLEERKRLIKEKKRVEDIVKLRSMIDISAGEIDEAPDAGEESKTEDTASGTGASRNGIAERGLTGIMERYYAAVYMRIRREWVHPDILRGDFEAVVLIKIERDGDVRVLGIEKSSGNALFDRSVVRAVKKASPLSKPPFAMEIGLRFRP